MNRRLFFLNQPLGATKPTVGKVVSAVRFQMSGIFLKIIGSAAGGGFPQWNCNYYLSRQAREQNRDITPRTQSSIIASADKKRFVLFNASPDLRQQINETPELHPSTSGPLRNTPIAAVVLTNADIDHIAGLLNLRERQPLMIYATRRVLQTLDDNPVFRVLDSAIVKKQELVLDKATQLCNVDGIPLGITIEAFAVPGKIALFMEDVSKPDFGSAEGDTIGLKIAGSGGEAAAFYIPGCAAVDESLKARVNGARCLLFDGTLYRDDEMIAAGLGPKAGKRMGHISMSGADGSVAAWAGVDIERKIFVHINNSNPVLDARSNERKKIEEAGWDVAGDGMEINL